MNALCDRGHLLATELARRVACHLGHVAVDVAVVGSAGLNHLLADRTHACLVLRGPYGGAYRVATDGRREDVVTQSIIVGIALDGRS